jgi:CDGSH iron-sulfur domain-containing protein 3
MSQVTIKARDNGPFLVEGPVTIVDAAGGVFHIPPGKPAVALCRCGQSKNKPFCDGSHKTCNFMAAERAAAPTAIGITPPPVAPPTSP